MNYFALLNLQPAFELDQKSLEDAYFKAQRLFHPDRFVGKPAAEKLAATQKSMDINKAYETLKNPLKRAQYLLLLQGIRVGTENDSVKPAPALLAEIMELRESPPPVNEQANDIAKLLESSYTQLADYYKNSDFNAMAQEVLRLGYLEKIAKTIS